MALSLYIHIPYCLYKCHYCDFNSYAFERQAIPWQGYEQALHHEWQLLLEDEHLCVRDTLAQSSAIATIFFGGGTPSLMPPAMIEKILAMTQKSYSLTSDCEITLEANPGTISLSSLRDFKNAGINRLSLGGQSFDDKNLVRFGRIHSGQQAREAMSAARTVFANWSTDLIYGFPDQTVRDWEKDLNILLDLGPPHFSLYQLTAEAGTKFTADLKQKRVTPCASENVAAMEEITHLQLSSRAWQRYEIANFALPGWECRHNMNYWHYQPYAALGAGAVGFYQQPAKPWTIGLRRQSQPAPTHYLKAWSLLALMAGEVRQQRFVAREEITPATALIEYLMMGLRLSAGVNLDILEKRFPDWRARTAWQSCLERGWLISADNHLRVAKPQRSMTDEIILHLTATQYDPAHDLHPALTK